MEEISQFSEAAHASVHKGRLRTLEGLIDDGVSPSRLPRIDSSNTNIEFIGPAELSEASVGVELIIGSVEDQQLVLVDVGGTQQPGVFSTIRTLDEKEIELVEAISVLCDQDNHLTLVGIPGGPTVPSDGEVAILAEQSRFVAGSLQPTNGWVFALEDGERLRPVWNIWEPGEFDGRTLDDLIAAFDESR